MFKEHRWEYVQTYNTQFIYSRVAILRLGTITIIIPENITVATRVFLSTALYNTDVTIGGKPPITIYSSLIFFSFF